MNLNPDQSPESASEPKPRQDGLPAGRVLEMLQTQRSLVRWGTVKLSLEILPLLGLATSLIETHRLIAALFWPDVAVSIAVGYYAYRAAAGIHGPWAGIFFALAALPPCVGQLFALMLSSDLRDVLRQAGAEVGFFGATTNQLRTWQTQANRESTAV